MNSTLEDFDLTDILDSEETISEYLSQVLADGDTDELLRAIGYVAKARGMAQLARESGIGREGLYKALRAGSHPQFETIIKVLHSLNINLVAVSR